MDVKGSLRVAKLVAELEEIKGRKKLQKIVHLLQAKGFDDFDQNFVLYYYGPFSRRLASQLDFLGRVELVKEKKKDGAYTISCTKKHRERLNEHRRDNEPRPKWSSFAKLLKKEDTPFLEAVSTWVYLCHTKLSPEKRKPEFERAKPHLMHRLDAAKAFAKNHRLVSGGQ